MIHCWTKTHRCGSLLLFPKYKTALRKTASSAQVAPAASNWTAVCLERPTSTLQDHRWPLGHLNIQILSFNDAPYGFYPEGTWPPPTAATEQLASVFRPSKLFEKKALSGGLSLSR